MTMTNEVAKTLLRKHEPRVVEHIREWRERYERNPARPGRSFPSSPPWPADSPCYYCDGGDLCKICIHNDQALIWRLADYKQRNAAYLDASAKATVDASGFIQFLVKNGIQVNVGAGVELSVSGDTGNIVDISCKKLQQEPQDD